MNIFEMLAAIADFSLFLFAVGIIIAGLAFAIDWFFDL